MYLQEVETNDLIKRMGTLQTQIAELRAEVKKINTEIDRRQVIEDAKRVADSMPERMREAVLAELSNTKAANIAQKKKAK